MESDHNVPVILSQSIVREQIVAEIDLNGEKDSGDHACHSVNQDVDRHQDSHEQKSVINADSLVAHGEFTEWSSIVEHTEQRESDRGDTEDMDPFVPK